MLLSPALAYSAENDEPGAHTIATSQPSMELIEFLGDFETEQGEWLDPTDLDCAAFPDLEQDNEKTTF